MKLGKLIGGICVGALVAGLIPYSVKQDMPTPVEGRAEMEGNTQSSETTAGLAEAMLILTAPHLPHHPPEPT